MRALIQRVSRASVTAAGHRAAIGPGLAVLLGVKRGDDRAAAQWLARKTAGLRIFEDDQGKMNRSLLDVGGGALVVSQFTLYGDADRGMRPSFVEAARPEEAEALYQEYVAALRGAGVSEIATGVFRAMMTVEIVNEGPVTVMVETRDAGGGGSKRGESKSGGVADSESSARVSPPASVGTASRRALVLASSSPRRTELLTKAGIEHEVAPVDADERMEPGVPPAELAIRLALRKAEAAADRWPGRMILAADTIVDIDETPLGKPANDHDARAMLRALSGRSHDVHTGVAVVTADGTKRAAVETTRVTFRDLTDREIRDYVATGEPRDKAGAYGIQGRGAMLVERIDGNYENVMGLPLNRVIALLREVSE